MVKNKEKYYVKMASHCCPWMYFQKKKVHVIYPKVLGVFNKDLK
jgi:hypothetical protein